MINRYKIRKAEYPAAKLYMEGKSFKKDAPSWAIKFKDNLKFKKKILYYNDLLVIPQEEVDDYLRKQVYDKDSDLPLSRDGGFHLLKKRIVGITRTRLMKFLKAQPAVESTKNANRKAKQTSGPKMKNYMFECDLVFIRKPDLVKVHPKFEKTVKAHETYIVSVVEKVTGLTRLGYVLTKEQNIVTPMVIKFIKSICNQLGVNPKKYRGQSDSGGEFNKEQLGNVLAGWDFVKLGSSIEKKNQTIQSRLFQLARAKRGFRVKTLLKQVEKIENQNYNSVQKKTPNELAEEQKEEKEKEVEQVAKYNKKRKVHIGGNPTVFKVGDYVRIQVLYGKDLKGVGFKSYKNETWSKRVYKITQATKKSKPPKYRVNRKWMLGDRLSLTEMPDKKSEKLMEERDKQALALDELKRKHEIMQHYKEKREREEEEARMRPKRKGRPNLLESRYARAERRRKAKQT